ncbi:hypothetical protein Q4E40_19120 [Pontibacter sp. BT731]|uniref:hypothetical protein n=1 Tax=Pontibacter coccineus TaxID=3063328 RepID=UPI0026E1E403|nr:hypothetical protein [Pontibacter sp. BT731]MDO6392254.1 hypothetical protein [Pontibacter sp. BT731]
MENVTRQELEELISRYKHYIHLNETIIKTKLDVINSDNIYINVGGNHGDILELVECRVKMQSFHSVIKDLEDILSRIK